MGITVSGGGFGGLIFSLSVNKMLLDLEDQKWALRMVCFVTLFAATMAIFVLEPYQPVARKRNRLGKIEQFKTSLASIFDRHF